MFMMSVRLPDDTEAQFWREVSAGYGAEDLISRALETLSPDDKRDLAAQLQRSASRAEGYEG